MKEGTLRGVCTMVKNMDSFHVINILSNLIEMISLYNLVKLNLGNSPYY